MSILYHNYVNLSNTSALLLDVAPLNWSKAYFGMGSAEKIIA